MELKAKWRKINEIESTLFGKINTINELLQK